MARATAQRRDALRKTLIDIAETRIEAEGIGAIKARPLAEAAGCSVGAIYTVFEELHDIVIAVNGRTFRRLGAKVAADVESQTLAPVETLIALSHAYLHFAAQNPRSWRTLFDVEFTDDMEVPDWYLEELRRLFDFIAAPLRALFPQESDDQIQMLTRGLFSSVHGIVLLGLERRISGVPLERLEEMISLILRQLTKQTVS